MADQKELSEAELREMSLGNLVNALIKSNTKKEQLMSESALKLKERVAALRSGESFNLEEYYTPVFNQLWDYLKGEKDIISEIDRREKLYEKK